MKRRFLAQLKTVFVSLVFATTMMIVPTAIHAQSSTTTAQSRNTSSNVLVQGPVTGSTTGAFSGILNITKFAVQNGQLVAQGLLNGTVTDATSGATTAISNLAVSVPVTSASAGCPILTLTLGPLHLNLLGLVIDLNQINLSIVAQPGAGNLLGNLLCDVANLLNNGGALTSLVNDLNSLLGILNGL